MPPTTTALPDPALLATLRDRLLPLQHKLSLPQLLSLLSIAAEPGLSVSDLGERLRIPQASASRYASVLLGRYEGPAGNPVTPLISQEINKRNPRRRALTLTDEGRRLLLGFCHSLRYIP